LVETDGHSGIWGYYDVGAERTLVVYMMCDVQPVMPADWESPPFAANIVEREMGKAIMARGAVNQKGSQRGRIMIAPAGRRRRSHTAPGRWLKDPAQQRSRKNSASPSGHSG
jgi:acetylornithine deacetylase/succinyl-diaminopimelate desuccinylase-like protein